MRKLFYSALAVILLLSRPVFAWHDYTHMAIAKAAGFTRYYTVVGPDITKLKCQTEQSNHWYDAEKNETITPETVKKQIALYDTDGDTKGHVLGSIVASFRKYLEKSGASSKDNYYYLAFTAHYIGDMSNPLHESVYDDFNKQHHQANDAMIEQEVMDNIREIKISRITIKSEEDLIKEIAAIAEGARILGYKLRDENRDMTKKEAYMQVSKSASLLKAVMEYANGLESGNQFK